MEGIATKVAIHRPLPAEEAARGDFYALLARLFTPPHSASFIRSPSSRSAFKCRYRKTSSPGCSNCHAHQCHHQKPTNSSGRRI